MRTISLIETFIKAINSQTIQPRQSYSFRSRTKHFVLLSISVRTHIFMSFGNVGSRKKINHVIMVLDDFTIVLLQAIFIIISINEIFAGMNSTEDWDFYRTYLERRYNKIDEESIWKMYSWIFYGDPLLSFMGVFFSIKFNIL